MRLASQGILSTGTQMLDQGIRDIEVMVVDGTVHVYSSTGRNGGIAAYAIDADGAVRTTGTHIFPPNLTASVGDELVLYRGEDGPVLFYAGNSTGMRGLALDDGGGLGGGRWMGWDAASAGDGGGQWLGAYTDLTDGQGAVFPGAFDCTQIVELETVVTRAGNLVVTTCAGINGVTVFAADPETGTLTEVDTMGAAEGLGIDAPTDMSVVTLDGQTYVLVAGAGTSSISVMRLSPSGDLAPTDHLLDNGTTLFDNVQAIEATTVGDHCFVVAGGADNGLSLFLLLPDGKLMFLEGIADGADTSLHSVSAIRLAVDGDTLHVFAGSQNDSGLSHFTIDLSRLGSLLRGTAQAEQISGGARDDILMGWGADDTLSGGGGDDVLIARGDGTVMTGGAGGDHFVIRSGSGTSVITDFQRGIDRLDLGDLPMLRDLSQLNVSITGNGAVVEYRGQLIRIMSADGRPLSLADLFPNGLEGGDHIPFLPIEDIPDAGLRLNGTAASERLSGSELSDTIDGGGGSDTIVSGDGDDQIDGGLGNDRIVAGGGNDHILGGAGRDTIIAGGGDDYIEGGEGADRIKAGAGNDTLIGDSWGDKLFGQAGDDLIYLHSGRSVGAGGLGNDTINGGTGDDRILGGGGSDALSGADGADIVRAGGGNDRAEGGNGNDTLYGGVGDDSLRGGNDADRVLGGGGNDTVMGDWGDDWLNGGRGNDVVNGGPGNDTLTSSGGHDWYWGGAGADLFVIGKTTGSAHVADFRLGDGDRLKLSSAIWASAGELNAEQVLQTFGQIDGAGNAVLDFSSVGGGVWTFVGVDRLDDLGASMIIA